MPMSPTTMSSHSPAVTRTRANNVAADMTVAILLAIVCAAVYANTLAGQFISDDRTQILRNDTIKNSQHFVTALLSDSFGFKGDQGMAWSNYWRPTLTVWLIANYQMFGLDPLGWHGSAIALHIGVVWGLLWLLALLNMPRLLAAAIALIFAVHPVQSESVAFISAANNMLAALPCLLTLGLVIQAQRRFSWATWISAWVTGAVALLAKENMIVLPGLVFVVAWVVNDETRSRGERLGSAVRAAMPFMALAVLYAVARVLVLGRFMHPVAGAAVPHEAVASAPQMIAFYVRQVVFPYWIGPVYPLRPIALSAVDLQNFFIPLLIAISACGTLWVLARRSSAALIGVALLALPLLPALNASGFQPEQLVHDRHLYLPLAGLLLVVFLGLHRIAVANVRLKPATASTALLIIATAIAVPLAVKTINYNTIWRDELSLWTAAVKSDPTSVSSKVELGRCLKEINRLDEARAMLDEALAIEPNKLGFVNRAEVAIYQYRYADAEADLLRVLERFDDDFAAYERLAMCYFQQRRYSEALNTLRTAREKIPYRKCLLTDSIAIILARLERKTEAIAELESVRSQVALELNEPSRMVLYRLGMLYAERNDSVRAEEAFREFLRLSETCTSPELLTARREAEDSLARLR